ncbi:MAG: hypothetical protein RIR65_1360, partial [Planctomycetota bacterium]
MLRAHAALAALVLPCATLSAQELQIHYI